MRYVEQLNAGKSDDARVSAVQLPAVPAEDEKLFDEGDECPEQTANEGDEGDDGDEGNAGEEGEARTEDDEAVRTKEDVEAVVEHGAEDDCLVEDLGDSSELGVLRSSNWAHTSDGVLDGLFGEGVSEYLVSHANGSDTKAADTELTSSFIFPGLQAFFPEGTQLPEPLPEREPPAKGEEPRRRTLLCELLQKRLEVEAQTGCGSLTPEIVAKMYGAPVLSSIFDRIANLLGDH